MQTVTGTGGRSGTPTSSGETGVVTRLDAHAHTWASDGPALAALGFIGAPECYSPPEKVYDLAKARGMDLVAITDHDTIKGAMELVDRGFQDFIVGQEVTVYFPEDRCKLHVLTWMLTPERAEEIDRLELRKDVYVFADWLKEHDIPHALAHPLYIQNGRLTRWHIERAALLFKGFEMLNGAHSATHRATLERFMARLTPAAIDRLSEEHGLEPKWPRAWQKARTGGSDDHGLLNIGRTWTEVRADGGAKVTDPAEFFRYVMSGRSEAGGVGGHSSTLAHQVTTVGAHYYADRLHARATPTGQTIASKLLRFAGVEARAPSRARLAAHTVKRKMIKRKRRRSRPIIDSLREVIGPLLEQYPDMRERLRPEAWSAQGSALSDHERMAEFADDMARALNDALATRTAKRWKKRDRQGVLDCLSGYLLVQAAQLPYVFSLFHQNKERAFLESLEHHLAEPGDGTSVLERPMRVSLFTDTLGDVNGVSRFIQNVAEQGLRTGRDIEVITSTRLVVPDAPNVYNFKPVFAWQMPRYEQLDAVLPPLVPILRHLDKHQPDVIHISTPGAVGLIGFIAARMLRIPVLGVYHTDFPAYIDQLFDDHAFTYACQKYMRFFYEPFSAVFTRSEDYVESLVRLGLEREKCTPLLPGFDAEVFHVRHRDDGVWGRVAPAVRSGSVKVLYVGRVSVEKNVPFLCAAWKLAQRRIRDRGLDAELVIVGDGPYRAKMEAELKRADAHFLGFRHGQELSALYATSDLFVFPSVTDTLGQVVMESQGSGLPVLVSDQGGPKEVVRDGETGFVLPVDDPGLWADHIVRLVEQTEMRRTMSAAAHESMQAYSLTHSFEHFWQVHVEAWHRHLALRGIRPKGEGAPIGATSVGGAPQRV